MLRGQLNAQEIVKAKAEGDCEESTPEEVEESLRLIEDVKFFLATAPANWQENQIIRRYYLNNDQGFVSCVFWNNLYYITGTDIVKCCVYRMQKFGREVVDRKKFEEGIFSDLRNLKCGIDATLETPKSEFLSFLFKNMCLKTQKKQKVFFWFSVPHDKLFADALERDMKRQSAGQLPTTRSVSEPALSFTYDDKSGLSLYDQLLQHMESQRKKLSNPSTAQSTSATLPSTENIPGKSTGDPAAVIKAESAAPSPPSPVDTRYAPQELTIDPINDSPGEAPFDLDATSQIPDVMKPSGQEEDDFPLDYFPVEVEYPSQQQLQSGAGSVYYDNDFEVEYVPLSGIPPVSAGFYENTHFPEEATFAPPTVTSAARVAFQIPPPPISATLPHFVTNGDYYASFVRDQEDKSTYKDEEAHADDDESEEVVVNSRDADGHSKHPGTNLKGIGDPRLHSGNYPPGSFYSNKFAYPTIEVQQGGPDPHLTRSYGMEDYLCDNSALYDAFPGGGYLAPPPNAFTPGMRMTPIPPTSPYVSVNQYGNKQLVSATTKNHPMNPYYQSSPSFQRWGNVHGYVRGFPSIQATSAPQGTPIQMQHPQSASRYYFNKPGMVHKPPSRAQKQVHRTRKPMHMPRSTMAAYQSSTRSETENDNTVTFSIPAAESSKTAIPAPRAKASPPDKINSTAENAFKQVVTKKEDADHPYK